MVYTCRPTRVPPKVTTIFAFDSTESKRMSREGIGYKRKQKNTGKITYSSCTNTVADYTLTFRCFDKLQSTMYIFSLMYV